MANRLAIAVLLAALLAGCGAQAPAGLSAPASATERRPAAEDQQSAGAPSNGAPAGQDTTMKNVPTDGLPDDLRDAQPLWESSNAGSHTSASTRTRLYSDGRLYQWSNMRRREVNGLPRRERAAYAWRLDAQISPAALEQVRGLIGAFEQLSPSTPAPGKDQALVTWRSSLDGREHSVTLPSDAADRLPDPIRAIERAIQTGVVPGGVPIEQ
ncbi:MAG TPA: hypothetical protein VFS21_11960 [Roseiflexaceae bacterium]|nr:hypothetical protein [Roseiflexaceae bacterium]